MRRILTAVTLTSLLVLSAAAPTAGAAGPRTVGGPRRASLPISLTAPGPQQHVLAETTEQSIDPEPTESCVPPRCYAFPFVVAPLAKGGKGLTASAQITWTSPLSRFWLLIVDTTKSGAPDVVAECFSYYGSAGPSATIESAVLKVGKKYAVWVTVQTVAGPSESVTGALHAPAKDSPRSSALSNADKTGLFMSACQG